MNRGKLDELASEIETNRKKLPNWTAGDFLLALVLCRAGKYGEAEAIVRKLPETIKKDPAASGGLYLIYAYHSIGLELEQSTAARDLAIKVYEERAERAVLIRPISI